MKILALESSCDETAAAVVEDGRRVLSREVWSQADTHALYGGVVPEIAARSHIEAITPLTDLALQNAGLTLADIDAIAVTAAPGLIGALLVGLGFAKSLALAAGKPLIPVHHLRAHIAAAYLEDPALEPPFLAVVVSGGHTQIIRLNDYTEYQILGSSRDDAAGEALDKIARLLGLGYPGGAALSKLAESGDDSLYALPSPCLEGSGYDMSFSGIKTAAVNLLHKAEQRGEVIDKASLAASFEKTMVEAIVSRALEALYAEKLPRLVLCGGVAANRRLRERLTAEIGNTLCIPRISLCGDNAAMVGSQAFFEHKAGVAAHMGINAYASYPIDGDWQSLCKPYAGARRVVKL